MDLVASTKAAFDVETEAVSPAERSPLHRAIVRVVSLFGGEWAGTRRSAKRHMRLIETLPLGPKKQLLLVSCDGERFLIGTGTDSVQSILRVRPETAAAEAKECV
jgi:hypothetical protein